MGADRVVAEITSKGGKAIAVQGDLSRAADREIRCGECIVGTKFRSSSSRDTEIMDLVEFVTALPGNDVLDYRQTGAIR